MQNVKKSVNNGQQSNVGRQRRKLRNENLELILKSSEALMEDFIELEVKFMGKLNRISRSIDVTKKSNIFRLLEEGQNSNQLRKAFNPSDDSILRVNAYIVEILTRDTEELIIAFPLHNIANVAYAKQTNTSHILTIRHGDTFVNNDNYNLYILCVENSNEAEAICKVFSQCFQLLYIERTMSLLDQVIKDETISTCGSSVSVAYERAANFEKTPNLNKKANINHISKIHSTMTYEPFEAHEQNTNQTIEIFIAKLKKELTRAEFESFGQILGEWQGGKLFEDFCAQALKLFGNQRKHLLLDIKPFVPVRSKDWFEQFLMFENLYGRQS